MIFKLRYFEKYLNILFVFLLPTQLALHFWPQYSFVFGLRVDYLSPTIYLTDVLFLILCFPWLVKKRHKIFRDINKAKTLIFIFLTVLVINILFSSFPWLSFIKSAKLIEMVVLAYYVKERPEIFSIRNVSSSLLFSSILFLLIGIIQVAYGRTLGGFIYWFGERTFSVATPGIAITNFFGKNILRIYSTFPHPNSLAGYISAVAIFLFFNVNHKLNKTIRLFGWSLLIAGLLMSVSLSAYVGIVIAVLVYFLIRWGVLNKKHWIKITVLMFVLSYCLSVISRPVLDSNISLGKSYRERLELADLSMKVFTNNKFFGVGLNGFIPSQPDYPQYENGTWLMQPVHNAFLLVTVELGILGIVLIFLAIWKIFKLIAKTDNRWGYILMAFVLTTSLFDHYWFTIQQNMLLLALLLGISFRDKK